jgi:hypothetical protein
MVVIVERKSEEFGQKEGLQGLLEQTLRETVNLYTRKRERLNRSSNADYLKKHVEVLGTEVEMLQKLQHLLLAAYKEYLRYDLYHNSGTEADEIVLKYIYPYDDRLKVRPYNDIKLPEIDVKLDPPLIGYAFDLRR